MNHAGHLVFILALVRQTVSSVALRNQRVLQHSLRGRLRQNCGHALVNLLVRDLNFASYALKSRARIIRDLLLREDAAVDLAAQLRQCLQKLKPLRQGILRRLLRSRTGCSVLFYSLRRGQNRPDSQ